MTRRHELKVIHQGAIPDRGAESDRYDCLIMDLLSKQRTLRIISLQLHPFMESELEDTVRYTFCVSGCPLYRVSTHLFIFTAVARQSNQFGVCVCLCACECWSISYQLATLMTIFTYKLATYLSIGDVACLQNASFRGSCKVTRVSKMCSGIPGSLLATSRLCHGHE